MLLPFRHVYILLASYQVDWSLVPNRSASNSDSEVTPNTCLSSQNIHIFKIKII